MKKIFLTALMTAIVSFCYGQQIKKNPYKELYRTESGITFMQQVNFSNGTRIEMEKQLEKAKTDTEREMIAKMFKNILTVDEKMEKDGMFFISVPEHGLEEYSNITFSATREKMKDLLKVLCTGDFDDGDSVNARNVVITYHKESNMFSVSKSTGGVLEVGFVERKHFEKMYEIMTKLEVTPALK